jgi:plasmid stabilization system protein ParE
LTARVVVSPVAQADTAIIIRDLVAKAGHGVAADYTASLEALYERLAAHPGSGAPRPEYGRQVCIGLVLPYVVAYRYVPDSDLVGIIRVLHSSRRITRKLLRGGS